METDGKIECTYTRNNNLTDSIINFNAKAQCDAMHESEQKFKLNLSQTTLAVFIQHRN